MRIGIDLGGTKIEIVLMDDQGQIVAKKREPTTRGSYSGIVNQLVGLVENMEAEQGVFASVGLGVPGSVSAKTGLVRNANTTELNGQPLQRDMCEALKRPVTVSNDANCLALSEATDGAGEDAKTVFAIILGTGAGAGVVVNGQVLMGSNGIAGEWGHNPLPWMTEEEFPGPECFCGKQGCIETFLSGPGMQNDHLSVTGQNLTAREIALLASEGDLDAMQTLNRYLDRLARALAHICNIIDPDIFVVGGGLSAISQIYQRVPELIGKYAFADQIDVKIVPAQYGDSSGVRGAAWLSIQE